MGLADRDYNRASAQSGGLRGPGWTATTWIMVLCVAAFLLDAFVLPPAWRFVGKSFANPSAAQAPERALEVGPIQALPQAPQSGVQNIIAHTDRGDAIIGQNRYQRVPFLQKWLGFSTSTALADWIPGEGFQGLEVWRFLGFQFVHFNLMHLIFNMLGLYFFGPIIERYLGSRRFIVFYLLCGCCGALLYLLLNGGGLLVNALTGGRAVLPGFLLYDPTSPLIGASAGVIGVVIASARLHPDETVYLFFAIPIRLATLAWGLVLIALAAIFIPGISDNAGGEAAHLGGAIAGWLLIRNPQRLHSVLDLIGRADPSRVVAKVRSGAARRNDAEIDRILEKISREGFASLSEKEKRQLRDASRQ